MNILEIVLLIVLVFLLAGTITFLCYYIMQEVLYAIEAKKYGKIEGEIINKNTEIAMTTAPLLPYNYYFIIEKKVDKEIFRRKLYVSEEEYKLFNVKDNIKKEFFKPIIKIN